MTDQTLLLKFAGPLQSWGVESRFIVRSTHTAPTKSGVLGMVAAALGRDRTVPLDDLLELTFAVRVDQPGTLLRDFQTAIDWTATTKTDKNPKLSTRYYLSDAVFVSALSGPTPFMDEIRTALKAPRYPLYLGRRSCPANVDLVLGFREGSPEQALREEPWHAHKRYRQDAPGEVMLSLYRDARPGEQGDQLRDTPISYDPQQRVYTWRTVVLDSPVTVKNEEGNAQSFSFFRTVAES